MNPELAARLESLEAERLRPVPPPPPAWNRNRAELALATRHLADEDEKPLTPRERRAEFNHLRKGGVSVKEAAAQLGVSDDTARAYEQARRSGGLA